MAEQRESLRREGTSTAQPDRPIPPTGEFSRRFFDREPNDPTREAGSLSDLLDELADAFLAYGDAFQAAASQLRRHQPDLAPEAAAFGAAAAGLSRAANACGGLGPDLRGFLPPFPWVGDDEAAPGPPPEYRDAEESEPEIHEPDGDRREEDRPPSEQDTR